jgi:hypothetical protein
MIRYMIDRHGRARIARFVTEEIARKGLSTRALGAAPGRPRLPTIKRIKAEDPDVSETMLRAMGGKLGLPADWLIYIGTGDKKRIYGSGADPDLIRVTLDLFDSPMPPLRRTGGQPGGAVRWSHRGGS